jgi:hypothetical protein
MRAIECDDDTAIVLWPFPTKGYKAFFAGVAGDIPPWGQIPSHRITPNNPDRIRI